MAGLRGRPGGQLTPGGVQSSECLTQFLEDLVRARPLARSDDEVDVAAAEPVQRVVGHTRSGDVESAQLVTPCERGVAVLEGADRLPSVETRVVDRDLGFSGNATDLRNSRIGSG